MTASPRSLPLISPATLNDEAIRNLACARPDFSSFARVEITGAAVEEGGYAVLIEEESRVPAVQRGSLAVFSPADTEALEGVYSLALRDGAPCIRRRLSRGPAAEGEAVRSLPVRKSFMTPTPLHIPGSRVSPIPGSAHEMLFLMPLSGEGPVEIAPLARVRYLHPLCAIVAAGNFILPG